MHLLSPIFVLDYLRLYSSGCWESSGRLPGLLPFASALLSPFKQFFLKKESQQSAEARSTPLSLVRIYLKMCISFEQVCDADAIYIFLPVVVFLLDRL